MIWIYKLLEGINRYYATPEIKIETSDDIKFKVVEKVLEYVKTKGLDKIRQDTYDFINERLAPAYPKNDGKQTPMKGHPVFIAQHACGCCCRGCLEKWHGIPKGRELSDNEVNYVVYLLLTWINKEYKANKEKV